MRITLEISPETTRHTLQPYKEALPSHKPTIELQKALLHIWQQKINLTAFQLCDTEVDDTFNGVSILVEWKMYDLDETIWQWIIQCLRQKEFSTYDCEWFIQRIGWELVDNLDFEIYEESNKKEYSPWSISYIFNWALLVHHLLHLYGGYFLSKIWTLWPIVVSKADAMETLWRGTETYIQQSQNTESKHWLSINNT